MTRIQRQIFSRGAVVGALITFAVIIADLCGVLSTTENWLYDLRARHFQFASGKPTDQLVHVDIDDHALDVTGVGTWPWPRAKLAGILDELRLAHVKAVALDILYSEPAPTTQPASGGEPPQDSEDAALATAIRNLGCVIVPASSSLDAPASSPFYRAMVDQLRADPEMDEAALAQRLASAAQSPAQTLQRITGNFIEARKEAVYERIGQEMAANPRSRADLRRAILQSPQADLSSPISRVFAQQFDRWDSITALEKLGAPLPRGAPALMRVSMQLPPLAVLAHAAAGTGFVDYKPDRDGVLRSVPLLADQDGHVIPQMGLSLALLTLGLTPADLQFSAGSIILPGTGAAPIAIPVHSEYFPTQGRTIATVFDIPWFGGSSWKEMYDWPAHTQAAQHMGINAVWDAFDTQGKIIRNNSDARDALQGLHENFGIDFHDTAISLNDPDTLSAPIDKALADVADIQLTFKDVPESQLPAEGRVFIAITKALRNVRAQNPLLAAHLKEQRAFLARQLGGKSILIGRVATGYIDVVPTSLHPSIPGVIAHGVIFNAIMTGQFWRRPPVWVTPVVTLILGLAAAMLASWLSPLLGLVVTLLLSAGYIFFNGYVLFDRGDLIVGLAGPLTALATVWAGCTLNRIIIEAGERTRITRRFSSYADPSLVEFVVEHPDQVRFEGETRELTVVFTDIKDFTSISEKLGEQTVPLLNEYLGKMVPIVSAQGGIVNKFLGDGIMFFFGAPRPSAGHAIEAVHTVLEMRRVSAIFNQELRDRGLPELLMRAGISTGMMVVGDAGTTERSDYTVLGDIVNLGARLESANKITGTSVLINDRTAELVRDRYLLRPIGALQVKGKAIWVMTYEPIAPLNDVTELQKKLVEMTGAMVDAFIPGDFAQCLISADKLEAEFGPNPLAGIYREQCRRNLEHPPEAFDGRIELTEK